ncbi:hypothetical protein TSOC_003739 [Tetrabaena socialis]|uniref:Uncharacterized protein n=1 Tax=Tetrabaena socialis TaxID=47790 RepID=A0A2J8AAN1_9CHLO|nr:hypothetical protein TSOC_003739 [Tetrabaena socialis]|eukprot:PNH09586.1 hypothetical protein TSOC_003739 [Tetrabaena socialis]
MASGAGSSGSSLSCSGATGASFPVVTATVSRHVNPVLGTRMYKVCGQQPPELPTGCSLVRWAYGGDHLVVVLAAQHQEPPAKDASKPVAARRLFGECLPSPATVRKQRAVLNQGSESNGLCSSNTQPSLLLPPPSAGSGPYPPVALVVPAAGAPLQRHDGPTPSLQQPEPANPTSEPEQVVATRAGKRGQADGSCPTTVQPLPAKRLRRAPYARQEDHHGIDLLLLAHIRLTQQEAGRRLRPRVHKSSMQRM